MKASLLLCFLLLQTTEFDSTLREGLVALQKGDLSNAVDRLTRAVDIKRDSGIAWAALAQARFKNQQLADADKAALESEKVGGHQPVVLRALVLYWSGRGNPDSLLRMLRKAAEASPKQEQAHFQLAQALLGMQRFDEAAQALTASLEELPTSAQLHLALGVARYGQRRFVEAIDAFLRTIELQPEVEQPYVFLGKILDHAGERLPDIERATTAFLKQTPENGNANLVHAKVLQRKAEVDLEAVETHLRKAVRSTSSWEARFELGVLLARKREYTQAAEELTAAIQLKADEPAPHYHLARVYDRIGKPEQAAEQRAIHASLTSKTPVDR
jgi:tetratricopeptide (TPR) repeat protein